MQYREALRTVAGDRGLHPKLIQANIALYRGAPAEARRLLQEFVEEGGHTSESAAMAMWLDAQAQTNREERIRRLKALIASVEPDNQYAQLARSYLYDEEEHGELLDSARPRARLRVLDVPVWKALLFMVMGGAITFAGMSALLPGRQAPADVQPTSVGPPTPTPLNLPDHSRALVADSYTARYPQGILQVTAVEEESERVIDNRTQVQVTPVPGARFFALRVIFECRGGICQQPPEANLTLLLDDGSVIEPRADVSIAGQDPLKPIALGNRTAGWVVFEIPLATPVEALVVSPLKEGAFEPLTIRLAIP